MKEVDVTHPYQVGCILRESRFYLEGETKGSYPVQMPEPSSASSLVTDSNGICWSRTERPSPIQGSS